MLQGLGQKHQPMLPATEDEEEQEQEVAEQEKHSNDRVESWAKAVSQDGIDPTDAAVNVAVEDDERESRFDRPLKEVRVGESPSRPWGIAVPFNHVPPERYEEHETPGSPPAPVMMPNIASAPKASGCPFSGAFGTKAEVPQGHPPVSAGAAKCPFSGAKQEETIDTPDSTAPSKNDLDRLGIHDSQRQSQPQPNQPRAIGQEQPPFQPHAQSAAPPPPAATQPVFLTQPTPQMVFNGPVFIGYPVDQAMMLMQQWQAGSQQPPN
jgi:hypothetical protein